MIDIHKNHYTFIVSGQEEKERKTFYNVQSEEVMLCGADIPSDNKTQLTYLYSWSFTGSNGDVFLLSAKEEDSNITVTYLVDSLKSKYSVTDDFSLKVQNVDLRDTGLYECSVAAFRDSHLVEKYENTTHLFVQGLFQYKLKVIPF